MANHRNSESPRINKARSAWFVIGVLVLANVLNFLDRQLLSANAPLVKSEFHLSNFQYGELISAFSLVYAVMAPFAGAMLDRFGLVAAVAASVGVWSVGSALTGLTNTFRGLLFSRMILALGEAAALPCAGKATAEYLPASEWGFANTTGSLAITAGVIGAPLLAASLSPAYGWRSAFMLSGVLGGLWVLLWYFTATKIRPSIAALDRRDRAIADILGDKRMWFTALSYSLVMAQYMFWLNWTTVYLVQERHFTTADANRYLVWVPPALAVFGGILSGGTSFLWINRGIDAVSARMRFCWLCGPVGLATGLVPWLHSTSMAIMAISVSLLVCTAIFTSINLIPLDLFGSAHAGLSTSVLACSYALLQTFVAPLTGRLIDFAGFRLLCVLLSVFPLLALGILTLALRQPAQPSQLAAARAANA